jgi:hypothetical protein
LVVGCHGHSKAVSSLRFATAVQGDGGGEAALVRFGSVFIFYPIQGLATPDKT